MNLDEPEAYKKNKKWSRFQNDLTKCLHSLEKAPISDWASLNNGLGSLQKCVDSYKDFSDIPEKMLFFRVMCKCLDPQNVAGVHRRAVETLNKVCTRLGPENMARYLPLFSCNLFALLPTAAMSARPDILRCIETHFLPLPVEPLKACMGGLVAAVLPSLEESETSDGFGQVMSMLNKMLAKLSEASEDGEQVSILFHTVWSIVRNAPPLRVGGLIFLRKKLPKAQPTPEEESNEGFDIHSALTDEVLGNDPTLVLFALNNAIKDGSEKCQRQALDLLIYCFPLHEDGVLSFGDKVQLMISALTVVVTNPTNATLRRVFMWMYGGDQINVRYYRTVTQRFVLEALTDMMDVFAASNGTGSTLVFEAFLALQQRPEGEEHFADIIPDFVPKMCTGLMCLVRDEASVKEASNSTMLRKLFQVISWSHFLQFVLQLVEELREFVQQDACSLRDVAGDILGKVSAIVEITRAHYMASSSSNSQHLELIAQICTKLCTTMQCLCAERAAGRVESAELASVVRSGLEIFHVIYFGITRGIISRMNRTPIDSQRAESPMPSDASSEPRFGPTGSERELQPDAESVPLTQKPETTAVLFNSLAALYVAIIDVQINVKSTADQIFSTDVHVTTNSDDVMLFAETADTLYFVLRHLRQEEQPIDDEEVVPSWLEKTLAVISEGSTPVAVTAAQLYMDATLEKLVSPGTQRQLLKMNAPRKVIQRIWPFLVIHESEHHVTVAKLLLRAAANDEMRPIVSDIMERSSSANCRQFTMLFRVLHAMDSNEFPFLSGLLMVLGCLDSREANLRLISYAFVEQSMPYIQRVVEPLLGLLIPSIRGAPPVVPTQDNLQLFINTSMNMLRSNPTGFVKRLIATPPPACSSIVRDCLHSSSLIPDSDFQITSIYSLLVFVALRVVRREHHGVVQTMATTSSSITYDESIIAQSSAPAIEQGDDTTLSVTALELLAELLATAVGFSEPAEAIDALCNRVSAACVDLLTVAVAARLPSTQVLLLRILRLCVTHLDAVGYRRHRAASEGAPASDDDSGSVGQSSSLQRRKHAPSRGATGGSTVEVLTMGDFFRVIRHGVVAAAVAEMHAGMCCYGLLNYWKQTITGLLPHFHSMLHTATYEIISVYCDIVRLLKDRPLCTATSQVAQRCFQGLTELLQHLFLPSTKATENVPVQLGGNSVNSREGSSGILGGWFGNQASNEGATITHYGLAMRELNAALETMIPCIFDAFAKHRQAMVNTVQSDRGGTANDAVNAANVLRQQVESSIRVLVDVLLKELELSFFEQIVVLWSRRNILSATTLQGDDPVDVMVIDLLSASSLVSPSSLVNVVDQLLTRARKGLSKGSSATSRNATEMPLDATLYHMLLTYMSRCKAPERLGLCFPSLLDNMLMHVSAPPPSLQSAPIMVALLASSFNRFSTASGNTDYWNKDKRAVTIVCRLLEIHTTPSFAEVDDHAPIVLSMKLVASVLPNVSKLFTNNSERLLEASQAIFQKAIVPAIRNAMDHKKSTRVLQVRQRTIVALGMLEALLQMGDVTAKRFKLDVLDLLFDQNFFRMPREAVPLWRRIFDLLTTEKGMNQTVLEKLKTGNAPSSILTSIVTSHDEEAYARGRLLKRLAFYVFSCSNLDREFIAGIRDRLAHTIHHYGKYGRGVAVRYAMFVFRVLMTRVSSQQLSVFWPVILPELIRVLTTFGAGGGLVGDIDVTIEALKIIDFSLAILPADFQVFRWVFLDDHRCVETPPPGSTAGAPHGQKPSRFVPLVRALHGSITDPIHISAVRHELPNLTELYGQDSTSSATMSTLGHQPLLSIPERCYFDLKGIDVVTRGLSMASNAVSSSFLEGEDDCLLATAVSENDTEDHFSANVVRNGDMYDTTYVSWLLEAEFLHVGVAAMAATEKAERERNSTNPREASVTGGAQGPPSMGSTMNGAGAALDDEDFLDVAPSPPSQKR